MEKHNFPEANICSADETGTSTIQVSGLIFGPKGQIRPELKSLGDVGRTLLPCVQLVPLGIICHQC
jgi:hypothetical protein